MGKMSDTFFGDTLFDKEASQLTRKSDPSTSFEAAAAIVAKLQPLQQKVYAVLKAAGPTGLTDLELEEQCADHGSTYRTRRAELVEAGLVFDTGRKKMQRGRRRIIWAIK